VEYGRPGLFSRHIWVGCVMTLCLSFPFGRKSATKKLVSHEVGGEIWQSHRPGLGTLFVGDDSFVLREGAFIDCIRQIQAGESWEASHPARRADVICFFSSCVILNPAKS